MSEQHAVEEVFWQLSYVWSSARLQDRWLTRGGESRDSFYTKIVLDLGTYHSSPSGLGGTYSIPDWDDILHFINHPPPPKPDQRNQQHVRIITGHVPDVRRKAADDPAPGREGQERAAAGGEASGSRGASVRGPDAGREEGGRSPSRRDLGSRAKGPRAAHHAGMHIPR